MSRTEWGLIEEVSRTNESGGIPERVFGLTDEGREFIEEHLTDEEERPDSYELRVERIEDDVTQLQTTVREQAKEIKELREQKAAESRVDDLVDELNGEYIEKVAERFDALDRGEDIDPLYEITFQREEDLQRLLSANNIQLLRSIARESPGSIRALAREVGRDIRQVHDNLQELETYGLVELKDKGRSRRPSVWSDDIEIEVPIAP